MSVSVNGNGEEPKPALRGAEGCLGASSEGVKKGREDGAWVESGQGDSTGPASCPAAAVGVFGTRHLQRN